MIEPSSYRRILSTTSAIAGASAFNIFVSMARMKIAAMVLGPAGIGLVGLFQNLISTAASISALGIGTVGTRQIAEAAGDPSSDNRTAARRALAWGSCLLALVGMSVFWFLREPVARHILGDSGYSDTVAWLALGVGLTVLSGSQGALLSGMRRIRDIALLGISASVLSTLLGIAILIRWGSEGLVAFVLVTPVVTFLIGLCFVARLPPAQGNAPLEAILGQWKTMARLGVVVMLASAAFGLAQLGLRTLVGQELGAEALGHFHAAWAISVIYAGLVFQAMGADYYPRLASAIGNHGLFNRMVNEQAEVLLLLAAPVLVSVMALAPWIINIAYSAHFDEAAALLRWQVLGDVLKVAGWPLGFINLVMGDSRRYLVTEMLASFILIGVAYFGLPRMGLEATGLAFFAMNLAYLATVSWLATRRTGFRWLPHIMRQFFVLLGIALLVFGLARISGVLAAVSGIFFAFVLGLHAVGRISQMTSLEGNLGRLAAKFRRWTAMAGIRSE